MTNINILYKRIAGGLLVQTAAIFAFSSFHKTDTVSHFNIISVIIFFLASFFTLYYARKLIPALPGRIPFNACFIGVFIVVVGAIVDIAATVICSPDLQREGNAMILMLLSENFSLSFIHSFTIAFNTLIAILDLSLWACFLKLYPTLIQAIPYKNIFTTLKWITGSRHITGLKNLLTASVDLPYGLASSMFLIVMISLYRFYMALMWFDLVPHLFASMQAAIALASIIGLTYATHYKIRKLHSQLQ